MLTWRSLKITRHEDAVVVATVLHASSDSEVLDWKRSCHLIGKCFIGEDSEYVYKHFLLDPEVVKKQYLESAKREEFIRTSNFIALHRKILYILLKVSRPYSISCRTHQSLLGIHFGFLFSVKARTNALLVISSKLQSACN